MYIYLFALLFPFVALCNEGLKIIQNIDQAGNGFAGETSESQMVLIDRQGNRIERSMTTQVLEMPDGGERSLITFMTPADVKGTKMLSWVHNDLKDDEQWLYLPSLRRVKRISGGQRTSSFMGSEFSYEDIVSGQAVEKFGYKLLSKIKDKSWTIESRPKLKSGYSKKIGTYSVKYMNPVKVEYYDRRDELFKIATFSNWKKYTVKNKTFWRARDIKMENVQTGKQSLWLQKNLRLGVKMRSRDFKKNALR